MQQPQTKTAPRAPGLERKISLSRLALAYERIWPRFWLLLGIVGVFLLVTLAVLLLQRYRLRWGK